MIEAFCKDDNTVYTAKKFEKLTSQEIETKRGSLYCVECKAKAWFTKSTYTSKIRKNAYFNSHHVEKGCDLKTKYMLIEDERDSLPETTEPVNEANEFIINLDNAKSGTKITPIEKVGNNDDDDKSEARGGKNIKGLGEKRNYEQQKTLREILRSLVKYPNFKNSDKKLNFYSEAGAIRINGTVKDVNVEFEKFTPTENREYKVYWGQIINAKFGKEKEIWLNHGHPLNDLSIKIFPDIANEFMNHFNINNLDELEGSHVVIVAKGYYSLSTKPIIYCSSVNFINLRRYKLHDNAINALIQG